MRFSTVISFLLFSSTAWGLQPRHHDGRSDGLSSSSVTRRRSFRPISRRRLAPRRIGPPIAPGIVPRSDDLESGWETVKKPAIPKSLPSTWTPERVYAALENAKKTGSFVAVGPQPYRTNKDRVVLTIGGVQIPLIVEELPLQTQESAPAQLTSALTLAKRDIKDSRNAGRLYGALYDGNTVFILQKENGDEWEIASVQKKRYYCGITGWDAEDLLILVKL